MIHPPTSHPLCVIHRIGFVWQVEEAERVHAVISDSVVSTDEEDFFSPADFPALDLMFEEFESCWRERIRRFHLTEEYDAVEEAARHLNEQITHWFLPVVERVQSKAFPSGAAGIPKAEITYSKDRKAVWIKGKFLKPSVG